MYRVLYWEEARIPTSIFISGKKRHGKDLLASQLRTQLVKLVNGEFAYDGDLWKMEHLRVSRIAFADPIKNFAKQAFGLDEDQVNGGTVHKEAPIPFWNNLTPREIMQKIGSHLREIDEDVFAKSLIERMKHRRELPKEPGKTYLWRNTGEHHIFINSDCRYPNEIVVTRQHIKSTAYVRIVRPGMKKTGFDDHPSETALDDYDNFDYIIMNDGNLDVLREKAKRLLASWVGLDDTCSTGAIL